MIRTMTETAPPQNVAVFGAHEPGTLGQLYDVAGRAERAALMADGRELVVVRKGATPAFPGQKGFIGGSMGDDAVIVQGTAASGTETEAVQRQALFSTVHGAGRVMSRSQAAGNRNWRTGKVLKPGLVSPEMMGAWIREKGIILRGGGLDESPHAYRRLPSVLAAQQGTIEVLHTLRPLIVVMAGAEMVDPYKD